MFPVVPVYTLFYQSSKNGKNFMFSIDFCSLAIIIKKTQTAISINENRTILKQRSNLFQSICIYFGYRQRMNHHL